MIAVHSGTIVKKMESADVGITCMVPSFALTMTSITGLTMLSMCLIIYTTIVAHNKYVYHDYKVIQSQRRVYSMIPNTTPQEKLNGLMCNKSNREGFLCSKCLRHHGPSAFHYKCIRCDHSLLSSIIIYLIIKLLPVTVLFIAIIIFRINVNKGPLLGYILFCQMHSITVQQQLNFYQILLIKLKFFSRFLTIFLSFGI